jgi:hypothetical protein
MKHNTKACTKSITINDETLGEIRKTKKGADISAVLSVRNAACACGDHVNEEPFRRAVRGSTTAPYPAINLW